MLSDEKCQMIYDAALTIIAEIGMTVPHAEAREMLVKGAGATVEGEDLVKIPREAVAAARDTVPSMIPVYDRNGELAMQLGGYNSFFGTGSDLMSIYDFETGERRPSVLADTARMAHLCDGLPNIDFIMSAAHPHDIEAYASYLECFRAMVSNTTKPMVMTAAGVEDLEVMWKIACAPSAAAPRSCARSRTSSSTASPSARCSTPPRCSTSCSSAPTGASRSSTRRRRSPAPRRRSPTPATSCRPSPSRSSASSSTSCAVPGSPLLTGMGPVKLDMNTVQALYNSAEYYTTYLGITEMAKWMDIPNWGYAGTSDSQCVDANAGIDITELTLLSMQAGSNLNHDIGYLDFGLTGAGELVVHHRRGHLDEPPRARGHRGQRGDARRSTPSPRSARAATSSARSTPSGTCAACSGGPRSSTAARRRTGRPTARPTPPRRRTASSLDIMANHTPEPLSAEMKQTMDGLVDAYVAAGK